MRKFLLLIALLISGAGIVSAQEEVIIGNGTSSDYNAPFNNYYKHSWNETIYQKGDIGGAGTITSVSYHRASASSYTTQTIKIYMGETTRSSISSTTDWTPANQLTLVYSGNNITIGDTEWETFTLNTPFEYSGENNLVVVVAKTASSYTNSLKWYYTNSSNGSNVTMYRQNDSSTSYASHPSGNTGTRLAYAANIKLGGEFTTGDDEDNDPNDYEYVDLNLPSGLKWATCNIGANTPEEYGNTYAWGEIVTKDTYNETNSSTYGVLMNDISGNANYDAATANWGGDWRLPRKEEMEELISQCNWIWTTQNGVVGYKVVSKTNGKHIFFPAAGYIYNTNLSGEGNVGNYWTSTPESYGDNSRGGASGLDYYYGSSGSSKVDMYTFGRPGGLKVRPVFGGNFDGPVAQYASVTTNEVSGVSTTTAVCGGNVTSDNGSTVTARGVCWSTSTNPTIENNKTTDGSGVGAFTSNLSNLSPMTTYYVRAYVTNAAGTSYGVQRSFTTNGDIEIGDTQVINYGKYSLKFTVTNAAAAQCEVICPYTLSSETSITIPSSVTFNGIACSVTSIGNNAFEKCYSYVTSITIPSSVTSIGTSAFKGCSSLTSISIPAGVTTIGDYTFYSCSSLTSVIIPGTVTSIGSYAFYYCNKLTSIDIPYGVTTIGDYAFDHCGGFTSITIPSSVTSIGDYAFQDCYSVKSLEIPSSVETIGTMAFAFMSALKDVEISNGVTTIGNSAFHNCSALTSIEIPNSVTTMGNSIFKYCYSLTSVIIHGNITSIGSSTFHNCNKLTSVEMPNTIISIGDSAFEGCSMLTSIEIPNSVTSIGNSAFKGCSSFTNIEIPNSVTSLGNNAFSTCSSLKNITCLAESVPSTDIDAFNGCPSNMKIYVPKSSVSLYQASSPWNNYTIEGIHKAAIGDNVTIEYYTSQYDWCHLKYTVTSLEPAECQVRCIKNSMNARNTHINIPEIVSIEGHDYTVTEIDGGIGYEVRSVNMPNTIVKINDYAFDCSGIYNISLPDGLVSIGNAAFSSCNDIDCIVIPNSVTHIGNSAFSSCEDLEKVTLSEKIISIGMRTFDGCDMLTEIIIPSGVISIGDYAFYDCNKLANIYCNGVTPATLGSDVFKNISSNAKIYVPSASLNEYKSQWSEYSDMIVGMSVYTEEGWDSEPISSDYVVIKYPLVIDKDEILSVDAVNVSNTGSVTVKDGGQLVCNKANGIVTVEKEIEGYADQDENSWHTIASPLKGETDLSGSSVNNIFNNQYDLYRYDEATYTWQNYKNSANNGFTTLELGRGYLYANSEDVTLNFNGEINTEVVSYYLTNDGDELSGFNLVGNPFTHDIYIGQNNQSESTTKIVFELRDSESDGWNGCSLNISFSDGSESKSYTVSKKTATYNLEINSNVNMTVSWVKGSYADECSFVIKHEDGTEIYKNNSLDDVPTGTVLYALMQASDVTLAEGYYTLSNDGAWGVQLGLDTPIKPCQGVLVKALEEGNLVIKNEMPQASRSQQDNKSTRQQALQINVANGKYSDRAFVVFDNGVGLEKINHENENIPLLYIPVDGTDYAIAMMDMNVNEIPINFETNVMGEYTISLRQENCEFEELYLLDKETNTTVNILAEDYTFIATSSDNPERFVLIKDNGQQTTDNSHFAYVNNGDIVIYDIEGNGDIQIFDTMGRCVYNGNCCTDAIHCVPMGGFSTGVYMIQKADESGVKVQKIIL